MPDFDLSAPIAMSGREFEVITTLARETCGIDLKSGKEQLVLARLGPIVREKRLNSFSDYYRHVTEDRSGAALTEMIDSLTTNFTSFFRESAHFDLLCRQVFPQMSKKGQGKIWSAGCSTGEEPYSYAFSAVDAIPGTKVSILATDISTRVLKSAERAVYSFDHIEAMGRERARKYFLQGHGRWEGWFRVKPEIRNMVEFRRVNLMEPLTNVGTFDVISFRNVMIYFDKSVQQQIISKLTDQLLPGGYLLIGHSETLNGLKHSLRYVAPAVYRKAQ